MKMGKLIDPFWQWYVSKGKNVRAYLSTDMFIALLEACSRYGSEGEAGLLLAGYTIDSYSVVITDGKVMAQGSGLSLDESGKKYIKTVCELKGRILPVERELNLPLEKKVIVGGMHTHPGFGEAFLSSRDVQSMKEFYEFAKRHPKLYGTNGGNLEIVVDPFSLMKSDAFKLMLSGNYEATNIFVKNETSDIPNPH